MGTQSKALAYKEGTGLDWEGHKREGRLQGHYLTGEVRASIEKGRLQGHNLTEEECRGAT